MEFVGEGFEGILKWAVRTAAVAVAGGGVPSHTGQAGVPPVVEGLSRFK